VNELALFAGAGGGLLASEMLGHRIVCAVELDEYCRRVLIQRQNDGHLRSRFPIWDDARTFDGRPWRGAIDVVSGGFPCQPFSSAARGRNVAPDLWPQMRRIANEVEPRFVFMENVAERAIDKACADLEADGWRTEKLCLSAADVGAVHLRPRWWAVGYTDSNSEPVRAQHDEAPWLPTIEPGVWWDDCPGVLGVDDGLAYRLERLRAIGNGQVPQCAAEAWRRLMERIA
jgi:DNA (cytosine-5)-methyltransferase 1